MKHKWIWIVGILLVAAFSWRIYVKIKAGEALSGGPGGPGNHKGKQTIMVEVGQTVTMNMNDVGNFSGSLLPKNQFVVAPKISGQLSRLLVNIGDVVKKGQIVAELDDRLFKQDYAKAEAALEMAQATYEQTQDALEISEGVLNNSRALLEKKYISQDEFNQTNSQYILNKSKNDIALATLHSSQAALESSKIQLSYTKITADWNDAGKYRVIGERFADEGSQLNAGAPIVSVLDIGTLIAAIDVIESDYSLIKVGMPATITTDSYPNQQFTGRIARIAPLLQEASRQARVEIEIANQQNKLKPGMFARVQITYRQKQNVTAVPAAAICKNKGEQGVFLLDASGKKVRFIKAVTGITAGDFVEIVSPPIKGTVVTLGQDQLDDGSKIALPKAGGKNSGKPKQGERG